MTTRFQQIRSLSTLPLLLAALFAPSISRAQTLIAPNQVRGINNIKFLDGETYACSDVGITAAITALPSTGGIVDGRNCQGSFTWATNWWSGVTKPVTFVWDKATWAISAGVTLTPPANTAMIGGGKTLAKITCANTGAVDCISLNAANVNLQGFTLNGQSIGTGHGIHVTGGGPYGNWGDLRVTAFGGNCIFMDPGSNGIQRFTSYGEIETDTCGGDGWNNTVTANLKAFSVAFIAHLETHNNTGRGYRSVGTRSVNGTCNSGVVFGVLRSENNTGDGVTFTDDCDQVILKLESEGSAAWGLNPDANTQNLTVFDYDGTENTSGDFNNSTVGSNTLVGGVVTGHFRFSSGLAATNPAPSTGWTEIVSGGTATRVVTLPDATGTLSAATIEYCGATSGATQACAKKINTLPIVVWGDVLLNSAATQSITAMPFTDALYSCTGSDLTTAAGVVSFHTYAAASVTIQERGGTTADHLRYVCVGH